VLSVQTAAKHAREWLAAHPFDPPLQVSTSLAVVALGDINTNPGFHERTHLYPVGYKSTWTDAGIEYHNEIAAASSGEGAPVFTVATTAYDRHDEAQGGGKPTDNKKHEDEAAAEASPDKSSALPLAGGSSPAPSPAAGASSDWKEQEKSLLFAFGNDFEANEQGDRPYRWTVFVRGPDGEGYPEDWAKIGWIRQVKFWIHQDYTPSEVVIKKPPFEVSRDGYGAFEVRASLVSFLPCSQHLPHRWWRTLHSRRGLSSSTPGSLTSPAHGALNTSSVPSRSPPQKGSQKAARPKARANPTTWFTAAPLRGWKAVPLPSVQPLLRRSGTWSGLGSACPLSKEFLTLCPYMVIAGS